ncbi:MAG: class I SAM-dependent methyltransferase [Nitrososphaera sp.]
MGSEASSPAKDLFSAQSKEYASSRPTYPSTLIKFIVDLVDEKNLAWDCATGNGQAAVVLADYFKQVVASDISARQLENAQQKSNITYRIFRAEDTPLEDNSVDLITIAQALHWFDFDSFYSEARRVLRKRKDGQTGGSRRRGVGGGGIIAAWAYGLHTVSPDVDKVTHYLYEDILGDKYWPAERKYVEDRYETIPFPFEQIAAPEFQIHLSWNLSELINYFRSWSSTQKFIEKNKHDPVSEIYESLECAWGGKNKVNEKRKVAWPLYLKLGRI